MKMKNNAINLCKIQFGILFMVIHLIACGQSGSKELVGKWVSVRVELKNGDTGEKYTLDHKPYQIGDTLVFIDEKKVYESFAKTYSRYIKKGNSLYLGEMKFIIEKKTESELVILESEVLGEISQMRTYYRKID